MNELSYYLQYFLRPMIVKLDLDRFKNILHSFVCWKMKNVKIGSKPFIVRIEPSDLCNLKCLSCKTPIKNNNNQPLKLNLSDFKKIYDSLSKYTFRMTFYMEGEPMTNPELFEMIKIAANDKVFTSFSTNFTLMREEYLKPLFDSNLDWLSICLDGYSQKVYEQYRVNGNVEKVKNGIKMVMAYKREHNVKHPYINIYTIKFNHVLPEIDLIKSFCKRVKVDRLTFRPDESNLDGSNPIEAKFLPLKKCFWPWLSISVDADGSVFPCPVAFEKKNRQPYGNLLENNIDQIWNNNLYLETRKYLTSKFSKENESNVALPCHNCRWYENLKEVKYH